MNIKKILVILLFAIAIIGIITPVNAAIESIDSKNKVYSIESKEKSVKYKITWNANGGKIETKKTKITYAKKGSKLGKLPTTPKLAGYSFKGWYTKKSGGTKISENTNPKKSTTYYAQWKKKTDTTTNPNIDSKLLDTWSYFGSYSTRYMYTFKNDGTFSFSGGSYVIMSNYKVSGGKITFKNLVKRYDSGNMENYPDTVVEYKFVKETNGKTYLKIPLLSYPDKNYLDISWACTFNKMFK